MKILQNNYVLAFLAGAISVFSFAPFNWFFCAIISISCFYYLIDAKAQNKRQVFKIGFFYGFGYFLAGIHWIAISLLVDAKSFAWLIPFALTLIPAILALYFACFAISFSYIKQKLIINSNYIKIIIFAIVWVVFEYLRSILLTGFPWNLVGYSWLFSINFSQLANIFGIYGLSFFAVIVALLPILLIKKTKQKDDIIFASSALFLLFVGFLYGYFYIKSNDKNNILDVKFRLVQGNIKQEMKWLEEEKYFNLMKHINLSLQKNADDIDAVLWSETAIPYAVDSNDFLLIKELQKALPNNNKNPSLISGALRLEFFDDNKTEVKQAFNSIVAINQNGVANFYDKGHLVPFGEYVPLQEFLPFIDKITQGSIGFGRGSGPETIKASTFSFSPLVCYEVIFPNKIVAKGSSPDVIINLTNDSWFGNSIGPYQHLASAQMRAIEYGLSVARVANSGITAFIDPFGRIVKKIPLNQQGFFDVNLIKKNSPTIYQKFGNLVLLTLILSLILIILFLNKNARKSSQSN